MINVVSGTSQQLSDGSALITHVADTGRCCRTRRRIRSSALGAPNVSRPARLGVTLIEVLMSLMIMSIGVVAVVSVFPLAILRSVQATNLTNAVFLRYNAETKIDMLGDQLLPTGDERYYVVDPLGAMMLDSSTITTTIGSNPVIPRILPAAIDAMPHDTAARRAEKVAAAEEFATLPDSWVFQGAGFSTASDVSGASPSVTVDTTEVDLSIIPYQTGTGTLKGESRIVLFDADRLNSHVRRITTINSGTGVIEWENPLPAGFDLGEVRLETREQRYTYLLSVRRSGLAATMDVAVFFRRSLTDMDEFAYNVHWTDLGADGVLGADDGFGIDRKPGVAAFDDDFDGTFDETDGSETNQPGSDDLRTVTVNWAGQTFDADGDGTPEAVDAPDLKAGLFMFDVSQARWYRIQDVTNDRGTSADLLLENDVVGHAVGDFTGCLFQSGIVDVYPLGLKDFLSPGGAGGGP